MLISQGREGVAESHPPRTFLSGGRECRRRLHSVPRAGLPDLVALLGVLLLAAEARAQDLAADRAALVALYNATGGPNWEDKQNWLSNLPLNQWAGVVVENGRVAKLFLHGNRLKAPIPSELAHLTNLQELSLYRNQLTGRIPPELGSLPNLQRLQLGGNQLTGSIPTELSHLANLQQLVLRFNQLTGPIPSELGDLANLVNLRELSLDANQLTGSIPLSFANLTAVDWFWFHLNPGLCAAADAVIRNWLDDISYTLAGPDCSLSETTSTIFVPVIVRAHGRNNSFFTSELALTNRGSEAATLHIETASLQSELTVTNFSASEKTIDFSFVVDGVETTDDTASFSLQLNAGEQRILPSLVSQLRRQEVDGIGPAGRAFTGALFATPAEGDLSGIVIGARTGSRDNRGGQYSLFYNAVPYGAASLESAWVYGLQQNEENRSNLALVNTGEIDDSSSTFEITIYDGSGSAQPRTITRIVAARGWHQVNGILGRIRQGYVQVRKVSGNNPFVAYGVINDGGGRGERSGDGAFLPAAE